jgi:hypothetical protein
MECTIEKIISFAPSDEYITIKLIEGSDNQIRRITRNDIRDGKVILKIATGEPQVIDSAECTIIATDPATIRKIRSWAGMDAHTPLLGISRRDDTYQLLLPGQDHNHITFPCSQIGVSVLLRSIANSDHSFCEYDSSCDDKLVIYTTPDIIALMENGAFPDMVHP